MRILVFTVFFALLAPLARADAPLAIIRCSGMYNCITINTGPCGTIMMNDVNGITPGAEPYPDPTRPRFEGVCGFYEPPYYIPDVPPPPPGMTGPQPIRPQQQP